MGKSYEIVRLDPVNFEKCGGIWDMKRQADLAKGLYRELL